MQRRPMPRLSMQLVLPVTRDHPPSTNALDPMLPLPRPRLCPAGRAWKGCNASASRWRAGDSRRASALEAPGSARMLVPPQRHYQRGTLRNASAATKTRWSRSISRAPFRMFVAASARALRGSGSVRPSMEAVVPRGQIARCRPARSYRRTMARVMAAVSLRTAQRSVGVTAKSIEGPTSVRAARGCSRPSSSPTLAALEWVAADMARTARIAGRTLSRRFAEQSPRRTVPRFGSATAPS